MIDRVPSGHIDEYEILKQQGSILAVLRPKDSGSTYMIGDDEINLNYTDCFVSKPVNTSELVLTKNNTITKFMNQPLHSFLPLRYLTQKTIRRLQLQSQNLPS